MQRSTLNSRWQSAEMDRSGCSSSLLNELRKELLVSSPSSSRHSTTYIHKGRDSSYHDATPIPPLESTSTKCKRKRTSEEVSAMFLQTLSPEPAFYGGAINSHHSLYFAVTATTFSWLFAQWSKQTSNDWTHLTHDDSSQDFWCSPSRDFAIARHGSIPTHCICNVSFKRSFDQALKWALQQEVRWKNCSITWAC